MKLPDLSIDPAAKRRRARIRAIGAIAALAALAAMAPRLLGVPGNATDRWTYPSVAVRSAPGPIAPVDLGSRHAVPRQSAAIREPPPSAGSPSPPSVHPASYGPRPSSGTEAGTAIQPDGDGHAGGPMTASRGRHRMRSATARRIGARISSRRHYRGHPPLRQQSMPDPLGDVAIVARVFDGRGR
ncbi:uncharacterized protein E1O_04280 [Burkholderiales bacterium GJ-E10]|nr:uncharacterized protein E1O_04280 [Burkholderiales bacterium GJ-E10]